jgi:hypothetical protein
VDQPNPGQVPKPADLELAFGVALLAVLGAQLIDSLGELLEGLALRRPALGDRRAAPIPCPAASKDHLLTLPNPMARAQGYQATGNV